MVRLVSDNVFYFNSHVHGYIRNQEFSAYFEIMCKSDRTVGVCLTEENQRLCSKVFPHAFQLLQDGTESHVLRPLASFIGLTVANNGKPLTWTQH